MDALLPTSPGEWWTAISAVVTAMALVYAVRSARLAAQAVEVEQRPLLGLERTSDGVVIRNSGRGLAMNVFVTTDSGSIADSLSTVQGGLDCSVREGQLSRGIESGNTIHYQDIRGRWHQTKSVCRGVNGGPFGNRFVGRVRWWRVPGVVRKRVRVAGRSAWEHFQRLESSFTFDSWALRFGRWGTSLRIGLMRWYHGLGESRRFARFGHLIGRQHRAPGSSPDPEWPINVDMLADCWKGQRDVFQRGAEWLDDNVICEVRVTTGPTHAVDGIVRISRGAFNRLGSSSDERSKVVQARFRRYLCGFRPRRSFVFSLRSWPFGLINWR
jgi:hypothetical protein